MSLDNGAAPVNSSAELDRRFSIAPMMDWTTSDYRVFARTLTR
ncbi:MAG: tRNA dihydrouridine(20/20a) synthase DusA, partial [Marinomonas sp.]